MIGEADMHTGFRCREPKASFIVARYNNCRDVSGFYKFVFNDFRAAAVTQFLGENTQKRKQVKSSTTGEDYIDAFDFLDITLRKHVNMGKNWIQQECDFEMS